MVTDRPELIGPGTTSQLECLAGIVAVDDMGRSIMKRLFVAVHDTPLAIDRQPLGGRVMQRQRRSSARTMRRLRVSSRSFSSSSVLTFRYPDGITQSRLTQVL
ncbi:hypothetical protein ACFL1V_00615 [Pseudomonadota bacterium]